MKSLKYLLLFFAAGLVTTQAYAQIGQETAFERQLNTRDDQPLREFVESKENIDVQNKSKNLEISGDVRFEWRSIHERGLAFYLDDDYYSESGSYGIASDADIESSDKSEKQTYRNLRGGHHVDRNGLPVSTNDFDVEFNLKIKYVYKDAWAKAHLQFDNPCGIRGRNECFGTLPVFSKNGDEVVGFLPRDSRYAIKGSGDGIFFTLKRAFIGYNIFADGKTRVDIEIGRQKLDDIFDSEIEFTSRFDGILLRYAHSVEELFDWYVTAGGFVIDERVNHFGYAAEIGFLDIYDTGLDLRYNFIDWKKRGKNRCFASNPIGTQFQNSQVTLTYTFSQEVFCKEIPIEFYSGFLVNHAAKKCKFTDGKKKNLGWYAGFYIGGVDKKGDWSLDLEYIVVQAQAVPEYDVGSIGRGNILDENIDDILDISSYSSNYYSSDSGCSKLVGYFPRRGNTNFAGWRCEVLYAITDNFSLDICYQMSNAEDKKIGGPHHYQDFEIEAIYAF